MKSPATTPLASALSLLLLLIAPTPTTALGINCRGSGLCPMATWDNKSPLPIMQVMRDYMQASTAPLTTAYKNGDHILCVSDTLSLNITLPIIDPTGITGGVPLGNWHLGGSLKNGGICVFPQGLPASQPAITLGEIKPMVDKLLEHGCGTCGSIPVHLADQGDNDPGKGILTFNFVRHPYCTGGCLGDGLAVGSNFTTSSKEIVAGNGTAPAPVPVTYGGGKAKRVLEKREGDVAVEEPSVASTAEEEDEEEVHVVVGWNRKRELSTRSAKFVERERESKGWIGWLR